MDVKGGYCQGSMDGARRCVEMGSRLDWNSVMMEMSLVWMAVAVYVKWNPVMSVVSVMVI